MRRGILTTANINDALLPGARASRRAPRWSPSRSRDGGRGEAYAAEKGIPRAHGSYEALLADEDVEAVYIPLPNSMHLPWSGKALEAGKHVLCEKPLSRRAAEVEAAFDVAERAGRILMEAFMWRYHPATEAVVALVREGAIGELRVVRAAFGFALATPTPATCAAGRARGRGADGRRLLLRERAAAAARASRSACRRELVEGGDGVDVRFAGTLRFGGDVLGTFDCGFDVPTAPSSRWWARRARSSRSTRGTARARVRIAARPTASAEEVAGRGRRTRTRASSTTSRARSASGGAPRLGRADAVGPGARDRGAVRARAGRGRPVRV